MSSDLFFLTRQISKQFCEPEFMIRVTDLGAHQLNPLNPCFVWTKVIRPNKFKTWLESQKNQVHKARYNKKSCDE